MRIPVNSFTRTATALVLSALAGCSAADTVAPGSGGSSAGGNSTAGASTLGGSSASSGGLSGSGEATNSGGSTAGGSAASNAGSNANGGAIAGSGTGGANNAGSGGNARGGNTSGGTNSGGSMSSVPATFETVRLVFQGGGPITPCASAPCHGAGGMAPPGHPLILQDNADLYMNLTTYTSKACGNIPLVSKGKPSESALIKILKGPCGETPRMPYGCKAEDESCIPDEYIAAISQWIANGAPKN